MIRLILLFIIVILACCSLQIALGQEQDTIWSKKLEVNHARVLKFSPDGEYIYAGVDRDIIQIETATGKILKTFPGYCGPINCIDLTPTGDTLICSGGQGGSGITLLDWLTGDSIYTIRFSGDWKRGSKAYITSEGKRIIALTGLGGLDEPDIVVFDINTKEVIHSINIDGNILNLELSSDGKYFCIDNRPKGYIALYDLNTYNEIDTLAYYQNASSIKFSSDGNLISVCGWDGIILIIDIINRSVIKTFSFVDTPYENILQGIFSNDSKYIILCNLTEDYKHDFIQVWDIENEVKVYEYLYPSEFSIDISQNDYIAACGFIPYDGYYIYFLYPKWYNTGVIDINSEGFTYIVNNHLLTIEFEEALSEVPTVNIYDISGKQINSSSDFNFNPGNKIIELDIGFLTTGVYLFEITSSDRTYSLKLLKE